MTLPRAATYAHATDRYADDSVATASPARLLVLLYDRLLLDLLRAEHALAEADLTTSAASCGHAQEIVAELLSSLDQTAWDGAAGLASLYTFLFTEISRAHRERDASVAAGCHGLVAPLRDAWAEAAAAAAATSSSVGALAGVG